jgi:hypothetical protein
VDSRAYEDKVYSRFGIGRFDDCNCKNKVMIESTLYKYVKEYGVSHSALVISGPAVRRHLENVYQIVTDVTIVEFSAREACEITTAIAKEPRYDSLVKQGSLCVIVQDVKNVEKSFDFEDLDLTQHIKTTQGLFLKRLIRQATLHDKPKAMIMTFSFRAGRDGEKQDATIPRLNTILYALEAEITGFNGVYGGFPLCSCLPNLAECTDKKGHVYFLEADFKHKGRIDDLVFLKYKDGGPMATCLILYK